MDDDSATTLCDEIHKKSTCLFVCTNFKIYLSLSSPRAESARAVTGRQNSHRWEGGRLFEPSAGFFYGNSCNSGTESRKIVSKVGN